MRIALNNPKGKFYLGDVRHCESINRAMAGVDYVFHAAALKQVPSCEFCPMEAVQTNILGTQNALNAAITNAVGRGVVLSTDKAVYPVNTLGISKAHTVRPGDLFVQKTPASTAADLATAPKEFFSSETDFKITVPRTVKSCMNARYRAKKWPGPKTWGRITTYPQTTTN